MRSFLQSPPLQTLRLITSVASLLTAGFYTYFLVSEGPMAPYNSVAFQYAWTPDRAQKMLSTWGKAGQAVARRSLLVDFAFMPCYVICFSGLALLAARRLAGRWQALGLQLSAAPWAAWAFDVTENLMLLRVSDAADRPPALPLIVAGLASILKFSLLGASLLYSAGAGVYRFWRHLR